MGLLGNREQVGSDRGHCRLDRQTFYGVKDATVSGGYTLSDLENIELHHVYG